MNNEHFKVSRKTKETDITLSLSLTGQEPSTIDTDIPFFNHLLTSMAFHGSFSLKLEARGDVDVDPHHLVEDTGLVLGEALKKLQKDLSPITRFSNSVVPMDESLAEVSLDVCGRAVLVYKADFPQPYSGTFDMSLIREFLTALSTRADMVIHAHIRYGENSHHMAEALFKALGKAIKAAFTPLPDEYGVQSTKGSL